MLSGGKLKVLRDAAGLTQQALACKACVSLSYINLMENGGKDNPSTEVLVSLANALNCSTDDLVDGVIKNTA